MSVSRTLSQTLIILTKRMKAGLLNSSDFLVICYSMRMASIINMFFLTLSDMIDPFLDR